MRSLLFCLMAFSCLAQHEPNFPEIAFVSDVHLQNLDPKDLHSTFKGLRNPETGKYTLLRTMDAQLHSTRLFNENYFAFEQSLKNIVEQGIKIVVMPGDFSDDGQPLNVRKLREILEKYEREFGLKFFITTGNHDPATPFGSPAGKADFLGEGGQEQSLFSDPDLFPKNTTVPPQLSKEVRKWGYAEITEELKDYGFFPRKEYLFWSTPFAPYSSADYTYAKAQKGAALSQRMYNVAGDTKLPDVSYVVEPYEGLWLLSLDGNVYLPKGEKFSGSGEGYKNVFQYKKYLIDWVKKIADEAERQNKVLVAFSHFPLLDFYDGAEPEMRALFGDHALQMERLPQEAVGRAFAEAGLKVHFAGHMHINDTGLLQSGKNMLVNVQVPSLAAYMPAYKTLKIHSPSKMEVKTHVLQDVEHFNTLFPLYEMEYQYLKNQKADLWDKSILDSPDYKTFCEVHLRELVKKRFLHGDWPQDLQESFIEKSAQKLYEENAGNENLLKTKELAHLSGYDMALAYYFLRSGGELAENDIGKTKLEQLKSFAEFLRQCPNSTLKLWGNIFLKAASGHPSDHFLIDFNRREIQRIE
ncbi:metallophosphoesterase [Marinilongibacter aquaticus]|uniref:metallophosphoesterase family protein n=1 Tax=Marinilongibacter aquaticus TaxID=2975157 RepID=UPI0021BDB1DD|nr:metallophosphoesterase [Marinilongibacter aquaticus]UBM57407.1 metallophosphoesterase [Marinilongibacter aquaticus]